MLKYIFAECGLTDIFPLMLLSEELKGALKRSFSSNFALNGKSFLLVE
jgi:hypothetical protein